MRLSLRHPHPLQEHAGNLPGIRKCRMVFTLIELLVVVSIIMVMMGLLLPALGKAKEKAREIACAGNLKQCGVAIIQYTGDSNGWTPCAYRPFSGGCQWGIWLMGLGYLPGSDPLAKLVLPYGILSII